MSRSFCVGCGWDDICVWVKDGPYCSECWKTHTDNKTFSMQLLPSFDILNGVRSMRGWYPIPLKVRNAVFERSGGRKYEGPYCEECKRPNHISTGKSSPSIHLPPLEYHHLKYHPAELTSDERRIMAGQYPHLLRLEAECDEHFKIWFTGYNGLIFGYEIPEILQHLCRECHETKPRPNWIELMGWRREFILESHI
jgi:hypothetical protein